MYTNASKDEEDSEQRTCSKMEIPCRKWGKFGKGVPFVFHLCSCLWLDKRKHLELEVYVVCVHRCKKEDVFSPSPYNQFPCQDVTRKLNLKSFLPGTQHKMCGWVAGCMVGCLGLWAYKWQQR